MKIKCINNDNNKVRGGYFAPARNQLYVQALTRRWVKRILLIAAIPVVLALVMALSETSVQK